MTFGSPPPLMHVRIAEASGVSSAPFGDVHPPSFKVRARWTPSPSHHRHSHGNGRLLIPPREIIFYPSERTHKRGGIDYVEQREPTVTLTTAWLCPPWANVFLLLQDGETTIRIAVPLSARRGLAHALRQAGIHFTARTSRRPPQLPAAPNRR